MTDQASTIALLEALRSWQVERHLTEAERRAACGLIMAVMERRLHELAAERSS